MVGSTWQHHLLINLEFKFLLKKMEFKLWEFFLGLEFEWAQGAVF